MPRLRSDEMTMALRRLVKQPGASVASVITLASGLAAATLAAGAGALILGLAMAVSLRPAVRAGRVELARLLREE